MQEGLIVFGRESHIVLTNGCANSIWVFLLLAAESIRANKTVPYFVIRGQPTIPTWTVPIAALLLALVVTPGSSMLGHACGLVVGYACMQPLFFVFPRPQSKTDTDKCPYPVGLGYLKFLVPPDGVLRFIETKLRLRLWSSYYVSVDQKTFGRDGVIPLANIVPAVAPGLTGSNQRLGPTPV
jgi:glycosylphosphatidylinositol transamidase